jgi:hypothetical protein
MVLVTMPIQLRVICRSGRETNRLRANTAITCKWKAVLPVSAI